MCGIFGFTNFSKGRLKSAKCALDSLRHRGPDQGLDYYDELVYMGHRRLSILDLSENGSQPMISDNGSIILTVNGEIYNYKELKKSLEVKYRFRSTSDSEVLLHGYSEWGITKLLDKIEGMFAFSIFDKNINQIFLVRDRVGIKPLYYSTINNEFVWASELKAIENFYNDFSLQYDYTAVYDFLTYLYVPTPKTLYKNIFKLPPAHLLTINLQSNNSNLQKYWNLDIAECNDSIEIASEKINAFISESVKDQLMSDVPLGFFLSGGLDSSTVVSKAVLNGANVYTYSIGFEDSRNNETHYSNLVANKFRTLHKEKILDLNKAHSLYDNIKTWYDEPFGDTSCFPTFLVSEFARQEVTVVLTGDGGDEIFGGYLWYKNFEKYNHWKFPYVEPIRNLIFSFKKKKGVTGKIGRFVETNYLLGELELYTRLMGGMLKHEKRQYRDKWRIPEGYDDYWYFRKYYMEDLDLYTRLQYLDFHTYLPDDILTKVDRTSMAVSLECRVPLLYTPLIEYLFSLPTSIRLYNKELKGAMKYTMKGTLPKEILIRNKKGFSIPLKKWRADLFDNNYYRQEYLLNTLFPEL